MREKSSLERNIGHPAKRYIGIDAGANIGLAMTVGERKKYNGVILKTYQSFFEAIEQVQDWVDEVGKDNVIVYIEAVHLDVTNFVASKMLRPMLEKEYKDKKISCHSVVDVIKTVGKGLNNVCRRALNSGQPREQSRLWHQYMEHHQIPYVLVPPSKRQSMKNAQIKAIVKNAPKKQMVLRQLAMPTKMSAAHFKIYADQKETGSEHARDAATLILDPLFSSFREKKVIYNI